jgi:O-acetyl-ADP-ribose deacetylase (regulator of RNase III)
MSVQDLPTINLLCMESQYITAFNEALAQEWPTFSRHPKLNINIINSSLNQVPATTKFQLVVSPANSYARLDGAFDDAISRAFCLPHHNYDTLTNAAQAVLYKRWRGFAPPGTCTLVPFPTTLEGRNPWGCKWVAICPTMKVPANVTWDREVVYECVWSLLCELERWNRGRETDRIDSILITPMATGVGRVSKERWAAQFVLALKQYVDALERPARWGNLGWMELGDDASVVEKTWKMM